MTKQRTKQEREYNNIDLGKHDLRDCTKAECIQMIERAFKGSPDSARLKIHKHEYERGNVYYVAWDRPLTDDENAVIDEKERLTALPESDDDLDWDIA